MQLIAIPLQLFLQRMGSIRDFYTNRKHKHLDGVFMETLLKQGASCIHYNALMDMYVVRYRTQELKKLLNADVLTFAMQLKY